MNIATSAKTGSLESFRRPVFSYELVKNSDCMSAQFKVSDVATKIVDNLPLLKTRPASSSPQRQFRGRQAAKLETRFYELNVLMCQPLGRDDFRTIVFLSNTAGF